MLPGPCLKRFGDAVEESLKEIEVLVACLMGTE